MEPTDGLKLSPPPYYKILGVSVDATRQEIRAAYIRLAKKIHPDSNKNNIHAEELFKQVAEAYATLRDTEDRLRYDKHFKVESKKHTSPFREVKPKTQNVTGKDDVLRKLSLTLKDVWNGGSKLVQYKRKIICQNCGGRGIMSGIRNGRMARSDCEDCNGSGIIQENYKKTVDFPSGIRSGEKLVTVGAGHTIPDHNESGNLIVTIYYEQHRYLTVQGSDLHYTCWIGLDQCTLGGKIRIPTVNSIKTLTMPRGLNDGHTIKIDGHGLPPYNNEPAGKLVITIKHHFPKQTSSAEREKLLELTQMPNFKLTTDEDGLFPLEEE